MTQEQIYQQINVAADAEGCNAEAIAEKAGYVPVPPNPESPAASLLTSVASASVASYTHTFGNAQTAVFEFPRGVRAFKELGRKVSELHDAGELIEASVLLITETSVSPRISEEDARWLADNAGMEFIHLTSGLMAAFLRALQREPIQAVERGKDASTATS